MFVLAIAALLACADPSAVDGDSSSPRSADAGWTSFRDGGASSIPKSSVPSEWNAESIQWQRELPGYGQSSPILCRDRLYVTAVEGSQKETNLLLAVDPGTGDVLFQRSFLSSVPVPSKYSVARAAPTPAVDEVAVYAFFESGDFVASSHDGETLWQRSLVKEYGEFDSVHGLGSSPALHGETLYLNVQHRGASYLLAIDKRTGENRWKVERPSGSSWATPVVGRLAEAEQLVVSASGSVDGYDLGTGARLWTVEGLDGNSIPSPTIAGDRVFVGADQSERASAEKVRKSNCCIQVRRDGEAYRAEIVWSSERALAHYASPLVHDGHVYYVSKQGVLQCTDAATGEMRYVERIGSACWCTPVACGGRVFFFQQDGSVDVVRSGREFELLAENRLWKPDQAPQPETYREYVEPAVSEPSQTPRRERSAGSADPIVYGVAASEEAFYIRTGTRLYAIGTR